MLVRALFLFTALGLSTLGNANNIVVSNVSLTGQNISAGANNAANFALVQFDLSWENSWRLGYTTGVNNWDAAWVFVKYRVNGGDWTHAYLNDTGHDDGSGTTLDIEAGLLTPDSAFNATTNPALGCFFYRNAAGTGNISNTALQLRWNYGANGLNDNDLVEVKVYAIEMAYVPQGGFDAGESSPINPLANVGSSASVTFQLTGNGSNGGTTFTDESAAANAIVRTGNTAYSTAQAKFGGSSVYFDGSNDNLSIGAVNDADFDFGSGDFTIELYVRPDGTGGGSVISYVGGSFNAEGWSLRTSTQLQLYTYNNSPGATLNLTGGTIAANTWHHIAVTRSGTTLTGYVNGIQAFTTTLNGNLHTMGGQNKYLQLGERYYSSGSDDWAGHISHVRINKGEARPATEFAHAAHDLLGHLRSATESLAMRMGSESALTLGGSSAGNMVSQTPGQTTADDFNSGTTKSLGANFPKGSKAFYCMKTEISQQQYVNFLNTLTRAQQNARTATALGAGTTSVTNRYVMSNTSTLSNRNGIRCDASIHTSNPITFYCDFNGNGTGGEAGDGGWIACNFLGWADGAAYMDWAGLRPMSELEFEKAARGSRGNAVGEYAWGSTSVAAAATLNNSGAHDEDVSTGSAIYGNSAIGGPLRTGAFAKSGTGRAASGNSLYGILDLSGNVEERTVSLGLDSGRVFTGVHGNGALAASGNADVTAWPTFTANGAGFRGGAWNTVLARLRSSDRMRANVVDATRAAGYGFRGVRTVNCTAPSTSITLSGTQLFYSTTPTSIYNASGGSNYLWTVSSNFTFNFGQGGDSISISPPNQFAKGVIYCSDVNSCGAGPETTLGITSISANAPLASGGTISSFTGDGNNGTINGATYYVHSFTKVGTNLFKPFTQIDTVDVLLVAGGAGGAGTGSSSGHIAAGGGGAGGMLSTMNNNIGSFFVDLEFQVVVGAGGAGSNNVANAGANGGNSSFNSNVAVGGGGGACGALAPAGIGGSGGGGSYNLPNGALGTSGQGNKGGNANQVGTGARSGGGGGGAGSAGANGGSSVGGNGGAGLASYITGSQVYYAGGGGGGLNNINGTIGLGGIGGGGNGTCAATAQSGTANTGGGGGGSAPNANAGSSNVRGGTGGSGIVIIRYSVP
jgi:formylglycine-generating enzyme required for sulfatase activity